MLIEAPIVADSVAEAEAEDATALIGPNAILQLAHAIEERIGPARTLKIMRKAGMSALPSGEQMIPEEEAIAIHHALAFCEPELAQDLVRDSGARTAEYIIANRIPGAAVWLLKHLPAPLSARLLMMAISKHAWTFVGSGVFESDGPWRFAINRSATHDWSEPPASLFAWYAAVFQRLFQRLIAADCQCSDTCRNGPTTRVHHYRIDRTDSV